MTPEIQVRDKYVTVNGLRLHYREWGRPDASPLLILHGITGHAWEFDRLAAALADRFHVLAVNQRGHGASAWAEEYSPGAMAEDVAALVQALELGPVRVVGHSMGGVHGWWLAAAYPERVERLAILDLDPDTLTSPETAARLTAWLGACAEARFASPEEAVAEYLSDYTGVQREPLRRFVLDNVKQEADGGWTWRFDARGLVGWIERASADPEAHWSRIRSLTCPALVVRAGESEFTSPASAERLARQLKRARLVEISGAGHDLHFDQFERLVEELGGFL